MTGKLYNVYSVLGEMSAELCAAKVKKRGLPKQIQAKLANQNNGQHSLLSV